MGALSQHQTPARLVTGSLAARSGKSVEDSMARAIPQSNPSAHSLGIESNRGSSPPGDTQLPTPDPSQTQWLNLLSVEGKSVLWWGKEFEQAVVALRERRCKQLTCIGPPNEALTRYGVTCVESANAIPKGSIDIAFIRAGCFFDSFRSGEGFDTAIAGICRILKSDGLLLVAIPQGSKSVVRRHLTTRALMREGFKYHQHYLEDSLAPFHRAIVPYSEDPEWAVQYLADASTIHRSGIVGRLKQTAKRTVYRITGIFNPRYALLVLARKTPDDSAPGAPSLSERTRTIASQLLGHPSKTPVVLWTRPYSGKQQLFSFYPRNHNLLAIGQVSIQTQDRGGLARQSYENLVLLSPLVGVLAGKGISVPVLLEGGESGPMTFYVRSGVTGENIDDLVQTYLRRDDRRRLASLVQESLDLQALCQDELTSSLRDRAPRIEDHYFENYLNLPLEDYSPLGQVGAGMVQHGDFAPVNILHYAARGQWGLIDWEWMRASYPPLFDVFTFFLRVHYLEHRRNGLTPQQELVNSVVDSFFSSNWFSVFVRDQTYRYCDRYKIPYKDAFDHFTRFLLFQCGRYRYAITAHPTTIASYEEVLKWSISHKERFVCQ